MLDPDDSESYGRERSLLSLGDALREEARADSKLSRAIADVRAERDAVARHRLARSRRVGACAARAAQQETEPPAAVEPVLPVASVVPAESLLDRLASRAHEEAVARTSPEPSRSAARQEAPAPRRGEPENQAGLPVEPPPRVAAPREAARNGAEDQVTAPEATPGVHTGYGATDRPAASRAEDGRRDVAEPLAPQPAWYRPAMQEPVPEIMPEPSPAAGLGGLWQPLIDPATVLAGIVRSKWLILAMTILGAVLGVLVALATPKQYEASAELLADPRDLNLVERELTQSGMSNEATLAIVENQVRILTSGTVLSKVVHKLNLAEDPEFNGQGPSFGLKGLISAAVSLIRPRDGEDDPGRRYALAAMSLARSISVERGGKTFIIQISATTRDAEKSALIANTMTDVFLETYGQLQSDAAGRAAGELTSKLDELRNSVEAAERKVEAFKAENDLIDAQGRLITDDEILKLNDQLSTARARTLELNARAASTRGVSTDAVLGGALPEELASPSMQELRAQYSALKGETDRLAARLGPRHPQLQALESQLAGSRALIEAELKRISSSTQTELKRAVQLEQELSSRLAQLKVRQGNLSGEMVTLRELERDATAKRAVYEAFLLRARETGEQQGINSANISVISKAQPPLEANPPSRSTIAMVGLVLGLMAGIGVGGLRGTLDSLKNRMSGRRPSRGWRLGGRRRAVTMFDQDPERPDEGGEVAGVVEPVSTPAEPHAESSFPTQSIETPVQPKDNPMYHPFQTPQPFDPSQPPQPGHPYAAPVYPQPAPAAYPQPPAAGYPQSPAGYAAVPPHAQYPAYAPPPAYAQPYGYAPPMPGQAGHAQPAAYPQPAPPAYWPQPPFAPMPQPYGQPAPVPGAPYGYAMPVHQPPPMPPQAPQRPMAQSLQDAPPAEAQSPIEEIRSSLREFRDAIRDLAESRSRRRYF